MSDGYHKRCMRQSPLDQVPAIGAIRRNRGPGDASFAFHGVQCCLLPRGQAPVYLFPRPHRRRSFDESAADGWRRRQGILAANANELGTRRDQPGYFASRGFRKQTGDCEVVGMKVVRARLDKRCEIRVAAKMRGNGHAAVDCSQEVGERGSHRHPGHSDAIAIDIDARCKPSQGCGLLAEHLPEQCPSAPQRRFGGGAAPSRATRLRRRSACRCTASGVAFGGLALALAHQ